MRKRPISIAATAVVCLISCPVFGAEPPVVIELSPAHQASEVDPNIAEIRVTFDRDMATRGYSLCGGGPKFPKMRGKPRWLNARTLVARVRLEADHEYEMSLNCRSATNFQAADGTPLAPVPWKFTTGKRRLRLQQREINRKAQKELMETLKEEYAYYDRKGLNWRTLERRFRKRLTNAGNTRRWIEIVAEMLRPAEDPHLWMEYGGSTTGTHRRKVTPNIDMRGLARVLPNLKQRNRTVWTALTDGNIGYLLITSWSADRKEDLAVVQSVLEEFKKTKGLLLDVRPNSGGDESLAREVAAWFVSGEKVYAKHAYRNKNARSGFSTPVSRKIAGNKLPRRYQKPVRVLMGPANMSSCEAFLLMMKQGRDVRLIGERSYGSSGNPKPHELVNGVTVFVPSWKAMRPDETPFEGQGIAPDLEVRAARHDLQLDDPIVRRALEDLGG